MVLGGGEAAGCSGVQCVPVEDSQVEKIKTERSNVEMGGCDWGNSNKKAWENKSGDVWCSLNHKIVRQVHGCLSLINYS